MRRGMLAIGCGALTLALSAEIAAASEKHLKYDELPPAVQKTARHEAQGATVRGYSKEVENGKTEYEVETLVRGMSRDVSIDPAGKVIEVEQQILPSSVPQSAMAAILKNAPGGAVQKIELVTSDTEKAYEAQILDRGRHKEVRVHADGTPVPEQD